MTTTAPRLTKEELAELALLEKEESDRLADEEHAAQRQHLEALRLSKRLAAKHGVPGRDFIVLETTLGNIAIRRPVDVEIDNISEGSDRAVLENFACAIVLEPSAIDLQRLMSEHHGLVGAVVSQSSAMLRVVRGEEAKK